MMLGYAIPRDIVIKASANMGFIIKVGCAQLVARNKIELISGLDAYLNNPKKWEEDYNKLPGNPEVDTTVPTPEAPLTPEGD